MPSISKAQAAFLDTGEINSIGNNRSDFGPVRLSITENVMVQYGAEFALKVNEKLNKKLNNASGELSKSITPEVVSTVTATTLRLRLLDYYDFINEGVKGVKSSRNAPASPYQYKTLGMSEEGRKTLRQYIQSGVAKVRNVKKDVAYGIGNEKKGKRLTQEETQVNTLAYLIKAYGLKASHYFTEAFNETFADFEPVMAEAVGEDIIINLKRISK